MCFEPEEQKYQTISSSFGKNLKVTIFGGSHEPFIGVTITGLPQGLPIDMDKISRFLARRAPGNSVYATPRKEADTPLVKSGLENGKTTEDPLTIIIENTNTRAQDYAPHRDIPRPGHSDYTAYIKYGERINMSGGGPFSARMTAPLCVAGAIALDILEQQNICIGAHIYAVGNVADQPFDPVNITSHMMGEIKTLDFPVINVTQGKAMGDLILAARAEGDSVGGIVEVCALGLPVGIGGPMYEGIEGHLSQIFFGIPAVKGVEFGRGFESSTLRGSENNDAFYVENNTIKTLTNNHGGILGGISSGMPLLCKVAFKPTPSIAKEQSSVSLHAKTNEKLHIKGRHDPCVVLRAVPVVEAALGIGLLDLLLERI